MAGFNYGAGYPPMQSSFSGTRDYVPPEIRLQNYENQFRQNPMNGNPYSQTPYTQKGTSNIIRVPNYDAVKYISMAENSSLLVLDSSERYFYIKSTDAVGMPIIKIYKYEEVIAPNESVNSQLPQTPVGMDSYVLKEEFNQLKEQVHQYEMLFNALTASSNQASQAVQMQETNNTTPMEQSAEPKKVVSQQTKPASNAKNMYPTMAQAAQMLSQQTSGK